jgi:hypothetical protein
MFGFLNSTVSVRFTANRGFVGPTLCFTMVMMRSGVTWPHVAELSPSLSPIISSHVPKMSRWTQCTGMSASADNSAAARTRPRTMMAPKDRSVVGDNGLQRTAWLSKPRLRRLFHAFIADPVLKGPHATRVDRPTRLSTQSECVQPMFEHCIGAATNSQLLDENTRAASHHIGPSHGWVQRRGKGANALHTHIRPQRSPWELCVTLVGTAAFGCCQVIRSRTRGHNNSPPSNFSFKRFHVCRPRYR